MGYEQCCMPRRADKSGSTVEWGCWGCFMHAQLCASLSEGTTGNYRTQSGNGKYAVCHTLHHTDWGLKFVVNLNIPLVPDKAFVFLGADAKLKLRGHKCWPGVLITSIVIMRCMLFVFLYSDLLNKVSFMSFNLGVSSFFPLGSQERM